MTDEATGSKIIDALQEAARGNLSRILRDIENDYAALEASERPRISLPPADGGGE